MKGLPTKQRIMALVAIAISLVVVTSATVLGSGLAKPGSFGGGITTSGGKSGTTLNATVTATGLWEQVQEYDWSVIKTTSPTSIEILQGQTKSVNYTITATRLDPPSEYNRYSVRGQVSVTNGGAVTTQGLKIVAQVQYKNDSDQFANLSGASQTLVPAQLTAGQTGTYNYEVQFSPVSGAQQYRVVANVTITNHSGNLGLPFGPSPKGDFNLPGSAVVLYEDAIATLNDSRTTPTGFTAGTSQSFPLTLINSTTITFTLNITNNSVGTGQTVQLTNTGILTEKDTGQVQQSSATVTITTGTSTTPPPPTTGQGYSPGYWKNHTSVWPSPYTTTQQVGSVFTAPYQGSATLLQALGFKGGNNFSGAVETLLRQGVAAVLNASSVTYPLTTQQVISQVNAAIASGNRTTVLNLASQLAGYNSLSS